MISDLPIFQIYGAMARHAAESQRVSAENISRAGEPGYKAKTVESFEDYLARAKTAASAGQEAPAFRLQEAGGAAAPNGNTVSIEQEVFRSAGAMNQHNLALTVYTKSIELMRSAIGRQR